MVRVNSNKELVDKIREMRSELLRVEGFFAYDQLTTEDNLGNVLKDVSKIVDKTSILQVEIASYLTQEAFGGRGLRI